LATAAMDRASEAPPASAGEPPRAFGSGKAQSRERLIGAPLRWPRPVRLDVQLQALAGIGPKLAAAASEAGIETHGDLLLPGPHSYRDRIELRTLDELRIGEEATVRVEVQSARLRPTRRRGLTIVEAKVTDGSSAISA